MELMLLLEAVEADCVVVLDLLVLVTKPLKFHWQTILFLDCIVDVNDICLCGDIVHCDSLATECLDEDLADDLVWNVLLRCEVGFLSIQRILFCCCFFFVVQVVVFVEWHNKEYSAFV